MIIKRNLYSLHSIPEAKKVAGAMVGVSEGVQKFLNRFRKAGKKVSPKAIRSKSLRAGVSIGQVAENPGKSLSKGIAWSVKNADVMALPVAKTVAGVAMAKEHPAIAGMIQLAPAKAISVPVVMGLSKKTGYGEFRNTVEGKIRNATKGLDKYNLKYFIDPRYRQAVEGREYHIKQMNRMAQRLRQGA